MVIVLWVSTGIASVFLLAEFILKYEHVRSPPPSSSHSIAIMKGPLKGAKLPCITEAHQYSHQHCTYVDVWCILVYDVHGGIISS